MNSRYYFRQWLFAIFGTFIAACGATALLLSLPDWTVSKTISVAVDPAVVQGAQLFLSQGCAACHQVEGSQIAPNLQGLFGSTQIMVDDSKMLADEAYLRRSMKEPMADIVKGYPPAMPPFAHLPEKHIDMLVAYMKSLK